MNHIRRSDGCQKIGRASTIFIAIRCRPRPLPFAQATRSSRSSQSEFSRAEHLRPFDHSKPAQRTGERTPHLVPGDDRLPHGRLGVRPRPNQRTSLCQRIRASRSNLFRRPFPTRRWNDAAWLEYPAFDTPPLPKYLFGWVLRPPSANRVAREWILISGIIISTHDLTRIADWSPCGGSRLSRGPSVGGDLRTRRLSP